jgi:hypothetical protein
MAYTVSKVDVWTGDIDDRVGGLAAKLEPLATGGTDLEMVIARRQPHLPGKGVVYLGPVTSAKAKQAAENLGLRRTSELVALRVEGTNKPGECARLVRLLADAGITLRGISALALGGKFAAALAFDNDAEATKAMNLLQGGASKQK